MSGGLYEKGGSFMFRRAIVIGCPGGGKSTFARKLRDRTGLPLHHLDLLWHKPDRTTVDPAAFDQALDQILAQDRWIIDGSYSRTLERRLQACDVVFFLDIPVETCLAGAMSRVGTQRPDLPWIEEALDPGSRQWIEDFPRDKLPTLYALLEKYRDGRTVYRFPSRAAADRYLLRAFGY